MASLRSDLLTIRPQTITHSASIVSLVLLLLALAEAGILFSSLHRSLIVSTTLHSQNSSLPVVRAGIDELYVSWSLNTTVYRAGLDASFKKVELKLCFAPVSQIDRSWRKANNDLSKDKTCHFDIASQSYNAAGNSTIWTVSKVIPKATYFIRAYAVDSQGNQVAYGQTTNDNRTNNLFKVDPISGRHPSLDIAACAFSVVSVSTLILFFVAEKKRSGK